MSVTKTTCAMKQILLLSVLLSSVFNVYSYAQLTDPVYSVPTADVATLGEFGQVPVSHFTGVPDVSVPLYTIDCGDICWPIGFAYHLGSVRVVADAAGNVLQRNDYLPYGEDYVATYAPGGDILAGLNIPLIIEEDDDEEEENLEGGNRSGEIEEGDEEDPGDEVVGVIGPEYYRSFNAYRFSGKEQVRGLYDFGARWFTPKRAHWTTMDPLAEKYYPISPYAYCAGNPVNLVDPEGKDWYTNNETGYYTWFEGNEEIEGYTYYGEKGSLLGEAEDMLNKLFFELYNNRDKHFEGEMPASYIQTVLRFQSDNLTFAAFQEEKTIVDCLANLLIIVARSIQYYFEITHLLMI